MTALFAVICIQKCLEDKRKSSSILFTILFYLPLELSQIAKHLLDSGAVVTAILTSNHHRRSALVQGGLEILCHVKEEMMVIEKNKCILANNQDLVNMNYKDLLPEKEIIVGSFLVSENSQESKTTNFVQICVVKRTSSRKKED